VFPKRNELVTLKGNPLSLNARKIYDYIYKKGLDFYKNSPNDNFGIYEVNIYKIKEIIGMNKNTDHSLIIEELKAIRNIEFQTYDDKYFISFPILAGFSLKENGILEVSLSQFLIRMMFEKENPYYHLVDELAYRELKSKYSKIILDLHYRYKDIGIPKMKINKFKDVMQYTDSYKNNDIERFVLGQAKKELEKYNNLELTWKIEKIGRKWDYIKLNVIDKNIIEKKSTSNSKKNKNVKKESLKNNEKPLETNKKNEFQIEKERISLVILNSKLPTRERIMLFGELSVIEKLEDLKKLEKRIVAGTITTEFRKN
ncbi:MAG: replication initiation protein, partial [Cetobacterium sp.]